MTEKWTAEKVEKMLAMMHNLDVMSLDIPIKNDEGDRSDFTMADYVRDESPGPQEIVEAQDRTKYLLRCIETLKPREQAIIMHRYGLIDGRFYTLEEVGNMYGITRERVRQVEERAIQKLKYKIKVKDKHENVYDI